jgi:hypothetical protein
MWSKSTSQGGGGGNLNLCLPFLVFLKKKNEVEKRRNYVKYQFQKLKLFLHMALYIFPDISSAVCKNILE